MIQSTIQCTCFSQQHTFSDFLAFLDFKQDNI